jgi:hypothetical protein
MVFGWSTLEVVSANPCSLLAVCQLLATGLWFFLGPPVSSTNKTDHHNITEILLKVALSTIKQTLLAITRRQIENQVRNCRLLRFK